MKKTTRWIGFLLVLAMVGSLLAVAVSADLNFTLDTNNTAYWEVKDGQLIGDNSKGTQESNIKLFALPSGLTDYTVEADLTLLKVSDTSKYGCILSNWTSNTAYTKVGIRATGRVDFEQRSGSYSPIAAETSEFLQEANRGINNTYHIELHFHNGTADVNVNNGEVVKTGVNQVGAFSGYVALMVKESTKVAFDNFKVTNNATSTTLWEENFDTETGSWGTKPAEGETVDPEDLGWLNFPSNSYYSTAYQMKIVEGAFNNSKSLHLIENNASSSWAQMKLLDKSAYACNDVYEYVFSFKIKFSEADQLRFCFNSENPTTEVDGDHVGVCYTKTICNQGFGVASGSKNVTDGVVFDSDLNLMEIEFNLDDATAKIYLNGALKSTRTGAGGNASDILLIFSHVNAYIDDLKLESGTFDNREEVLWSEDFEGYSVSTGRDFFYKEKPRPIEDYSGKEVGELIFADNYDQVESLEDFYFAPIGGGEYKKATYAISDAIDGTTCARITSGTSDTWFHEIEIVPKEVFENYSVYTIQMTVKFDVTQAGWFNYFSLKYNAQDLYNHKDSGLMSLRKWANEDVRMDNYDYSQANGNQGKQNITNLGIKPGEAFELALEVDCELGMCDVYINEELVDSLAINNKTPSALYILVGQATGYIDNVKVSAGTYADYCAFYELNNGGDDTPTDPGTTNQPTTQQPTTQQPTTQQPATTEQPDETPVEKKKGGCFSTASVGTVVVMVSVLSLGGVAFKKRRED